METWILCFIFITGSGEPNVKCEFAREYTAEWKCHMYGQGKESGLGSLAYFCAKGGRRR